MFWKIVGIVALIWIALALVGALIKGLFWILVVSAVVFGLYMLFKAISGSDKKDLTHIS
ncbi:hypothetical protein [Antrihabitans cavernicola]|uniref:hypothetical protein n=1 Tax=Antrihabitans cavernicola TaxID=2495913 RepID=UPI001659C74A|nr:hypothetical protein [Spelaeibacter cavernicola]